MVRNTILTSLVALSVWFPLMGADCAGNTPGSAEDTAGGLVARTDDPVQDDDENNDNRSEDEPELPTEDPADNENDNTDPPVDENEAAKQQVVEFLNAKVLTEISSSSNIGDISFIEQFRADLELCSNKSFDYFEFTETTIGASFTRTEFAAKGTWDVRIDSATDQAILVLNFQTVSEGEPFTNEPTIEQNAAGETFLGGGRVFVTDGDDNCE